VKRIILVLFLILWGTPAIVSGIEVAPRITDKEIIERLTRLEEGQKSILREMDKRFEAIDKRFEAIDKRFEAINKRFDAIDRRFEAIDRRFEAIDRRFETIDRRFEAIDRRFEAIDRRFETIDRRFEAIDRRFDQLNNLIIGIIGAFSAIVAVTIGFAIWDRRSMIRPFEDKVEELRKTDQKFLEILKILAREDKKLAEVLKSFGIL